jgi:hypothetical protein
VRLRAAFAFTLALGGAACTKSTDTIDPGSSDAAAHPAWRTVVDGLDGALLSIWGTSQQDAWTVGGPLGNSGFDALVLHYDGTAWHRLAPGGADSFWWVHGTGPTDVWMVGEKGRATHWNGTVFTEIPSGTDATLFGVWAAAHDDVWAVGGMPDRPDGTNDVVLHWDGTSWKPEALPQKNKTALFKVWGSSKDDLYVVGDAGIIWHKTAGSWRREAEGLATGRLTTVAGCSATEVYAVGGRDLLVSNGATWTRASVDPLKLINDLNGVSCSAGLAPTAPRVVVVGGGSLKLRLVDGVWQSDFGSAPLSDLHGAWADPSGAFWGVGGQFATGPEAGVKRGGVVGRFAADAVAGVVVSP